MLLKSAKASAFEVISSLSYPQQDWTCCKRGQQCPRASFTAFCKELFDHSCGSRYRYKSMVTCKVWKFLGLDLYIAWFPCSNEESRSGVLPVKEVFICGFGTVCSRTTSAQYCQTAHKRGAQLDSSVLGLVGPAWGSCGGFGRGPSSNQLSTRRYRKDQRGLPPTRRQELLCNTLPTIHNMWISRTCLGHVIKAVMMSWTLEGTKVFFRGEMPTLIM